MLAGALSRARIHGLVTNRDLLVRVLRHPSFLAGATDTGFLDRHPEVFAPLVSGVDAVRFSCLAAALAGAAGRRYGVPSGWRNVASAAQAVAFDGPTGRVEVGYRFDRAGNLTEPDGVAVLSATPEHVVLHFYSSDEDSWDYEGGDGWLASLIPLRADLLGGDLRCLYLAWLVGAQNDAVDEEGQEPPVPPGLGSLSAPLQRLADFLRLDSDLLEVAAVASAEAGPTGPPREELAAWVKALPEAEKGNLPTLTSYPSSRALASVKPTEATSGSQ